MIFTTTRPGTTHIPFGCLTSSPVLASTHSHSSNVTSSNFAILFYSRFRFQKKNRSNRWDEMRWGEVRWRFVFGARKKVSHITGIIEFLCFFFCLILFSVGIFMSDQGWSTLLGGKKNNKNVKNEQKNNHKKGQTKSDTFISGHSVDVVAPGCWKNVASLFRFVFLLLFFGHRFSLFQLNRHIQAFTLGDLLPESCSHRRCLSVCSPPLVDAFDWCYTSRIDSLQHSYNSSVAIWIATSTYKHATRKTKLKLETKHKNMFFRLSFPNRMPYIYTLFPARKSALANTKAFINIASWTTGKTTTNNRLPKKKSLRNPPFLERRGIQIETG